MHKRDMSSNWDRILVVGAFALALYQLLLATRAFASGQPFSGTHETLLALTITYLAILQLYEVDKYHPVNVVGRGVCMAVLVFFALSLLRNLPRAY